MDAANLRHNVYCDRNYSDHRESILVPMSLLVQRGTPAR